MRLEPRASAPGLVNLSGTPGAVLEAYVSGTMLLCSESVRSGAEFAVAEAFRMAEFVAYPPGDPLVFSCRSDQEVLEFSEIGRLVGRDGRWWVGIKAPSLRLDFLAREVDGLGDAFFFQGQHSFNEPLSPLAHVYAGLVRRRITPWGKPGWTGMADYICSIDGHPVAVSPGGAKPCTDWELTEVYGDIPVREPDATTKERVAFYLTNGRWPLSHGGDPGPRAATVPDASPTIVVDTASIAESVAGHVLAQLNKETNVP